MGGSCRVCLICVCFLILLTLETHLLVIEYPHYCQRNIHHHHLWRQLRRWRRRRFSFRYGSDVSSLFWNLFAKLFFRAEASTSVKAPLAWYGKFSTLLHMRMCLHLAYRSTFLGFAHFYMSRCSNSKFKRGFDYLKLDYGWTVALDWLPEKSVWRILICFYFYGYLFIAYLAMLCVTQNIAQ
jgi:hypothetical protein